MISYQINVRNHRTIGHEQVCGGHNLRSLLGIWLIDMPEFGSDRSLAPPVPTSLSKSRDCAVLAQWSKAHFKKLIKYFTSRTTDTQRELFSKNLELLGSGRHFGLKFFEEFGVFSAGLSTPILVLWVPCPCLPLFLQKSRPLYPAPKYLFGSGIWILAAKNLRFSLRVSVL